MDDFREIGHGIRVFPLQTMAKPPLQIGVEMVGLGVDHLREPLDGPGIIAHVIGFHPLVEQILRRRGRGQFLGVYYNGARQTSQGKK